MKRFIKRLFQALKKANKPFSIGITGAFGSGKSTAAAFFEEKGFTKIALSSFLEIEAKKRGVRKITRKILQDIGNEWREKFGPGILAKKANAYLKSKKAEKAVIDGVRNLGEVREFRKNGNFILVAVVADRKVRFERLKSLKRREKLTWDLFEELDKRDIGVAEKQTGLQVAFCIAESDVFVDSNGGIEEFRSKLKKFLKNN